MVEHIEHLFRPLRLGNFTTKNRMAMAPLTRHRSTFDGVPTDLNVEYYRQRAGSGLIVTEGTYPSDRGKAYLFIPGLCTEDQVRGWRRVTEAVHGEGGAIFCQIMHAGRLSDPLILPGNADPVAPSAVQPDPAARHYTINCPRPKRPYPTPRALTADEVYGVVNDYKRSAELAAEAGFDGVEIHAASGYLPHQFLSTNVNLRTDEFGGGVEGRVKFLLDCVDAMASVRGAPAVAVKVSPGWTFHNVFDDDPISTFSLVARELSKRRGIAYLQVGNYGMDWDVYGTLRTAFDGPLIAVGGFTRATAAALIAQGTADMVAFGQAYIANPDLDVRYRQGLPINRPDIATYYTQGAAGYTDYPVYADSDPATQLPTDSAPTPLSPETTG
ncbi:MAG: alkene reductase [Pseudomonadota bacterium]|nr:alkene reductase [Pseudomonadota bacterium]